MFNSQIRRQSAAGRETTALPASLPLPVIFKTSFVAVPTVTAEIQALEICQVFVKSFVLKGMEHLENSVEEINIKIEKRCEKWEVRVTVLKWTINMGRCVPGKVNVNMEASNRVPKSIISRGNS